MSDLQIPEDPIDVLIHRLKEGSRRLALTLMDEDLIIGAGNMSDPNDIVKKRFHYETLESEPDPNRLRGVARQLSRLNERTHRQLDPWLVSQKLRQLRKTVGRV